MPKKIIKTANGKYQFHISVGYTKTGKQVVRTKTVSAASDLEARRLFNRFEAEVLSGKKVFGNQYRLEDFAKIWLQDYCKKYLAPSTYVGYQNQLRFRIIPILGYKRLDKINPLDIIQLMNHLQENRCRFDGKEKPLSDEVISYAFHVLTSMFHDAVEWQVITNNPCDNVPRPKVRHKKISLPPEKDVAAMIKLLAVEPLKFRTLIFLAIITGLRRGEIIGLKWTDIDFENKLLRVERTLQVINGNLIVKEPKNTGSQRTVALSASLTDLLLEYKAEQDKKKLQLENFWKDGDWIFTAWDGRYMHPSTPTRWFRDFLIKNKLPHMPFHGLRHLSATILIAEGVPLKSVSSRLGHSDIRTTANIYSDALQSVDRTAANKMDVFLEKQKSNDGK